MPPRRTQAERVEETRAAVLEATIASLVEVGYAATTTREVAQRANVSRGAQTHHFPTKAELVSAAIEYLFARETERFRQAFTAVPPAERDLGAAVDLLWEIVRGPSYSAILEVAVAARTDDVLRVVAHAVATTFEESVVALLVEVFPTFDGDDRLARTLLELAMCLTQGAALSSHSGFGDPEHIIRLAKGLAGYISHDTLPLVRSVLDVIDD
jgi:AcrR family transcriptional regulator